ncbi:hypothetical protein COOONC_22532 [Cooperia oncophora]
MTMAKVKTCRYAAAEGAEVLALAYKDKSYEFVIFLPSENVPFAQFREGITGDKIKELVKQAEESISHGVNVTIPKFKMSSSPEIKAMLQDLGISELFSRGSCDLQGVSPNKLFVEDVVHKL